MWSTQLSRREFVEFCLGSTKVIEGRVRSSSQIDVGLGEKLTLIWDINPRERLSLPSLVIAPTGEIQELLTAIASAPQAPSPITSLSRVLSRDEAEKIFEADALPINEAVVPIVAALSIMEAILHADGRLGVRQVTPMICKRTLAFSWGKGIAARGTPESFVKLPERWLEVYSMLNNGLALQAAHRNIQSLVPALTLLTKLALEIKPAGAAGSLAYELMVGSRDSQEKAWQRLAAGLESSVALDAFQSLAREERGSYLQRALRNLLSIPAGNDPQYQDMAAACAFLATRLAPGSLEHLDVLRAVAKPELLIWYGLYAALQTPKEILSLQGGLGFRIVRDVLCQEDRLSPPSADIAFLELKVLARAGLESIAAKVGHSNELQVELVPYVTSSFTFQPRNRNRSGEPQQLLEMEPVPESILSVQERMIRLSAELTRLARDLTESPNDTNSSKRTRRRTE